MQNLEERNPELLQIVGGVNVLEETNPNGAEECQELGEAEREYDSP